MGNSAKYVGQYNIGHNTARTQIQRTEQQTRSGQTLQLHRKHAKNNTVTVLGG
jgi:hypothetical protein